MGAAFVIDLAVERELIMYKRYLIDKFYKNAYRDIMFVARNYDFDGVGGLKYY